MLHENGLQIQVKCLGYGDLFVEQGDQSILWQKAGIDADGIILAARQLLSTKWKIAKEQEVNMFFFLDSLGLLKA